MLPRNLLEEFNKVSNFNKAPLSNVTNDINSNLDKNIKEEEKSDNKQTINNKNRCTTCKKKTGLLGFNCKCGGNFCASHRHADQHECKCIEEMKKEAIEILAKNNIKVVADKLEKI